MPRTPTLQEVLHDAITARANALRVADIGEVIDWSRTQQTATIQPVVGTDRAALVRVPVVFPGVYWDLQVGERGLVVYADSDWSDWFRTGERGDAASTAQHDASLALFIPGVVPRPDARTLPSGTKVVESTDLRLGSPSASKEVVHRGLEKPLDDFLEALAVWGAAVDAAIAALVAGGAVTQPAFPAIKTWALENADYWSANVKVDD